MRKGVSFFDTAKVCPAGLHDLSLPHAVIGDSGQRRCRLCRVESKKAWAHARLEFCRINKGRRLARLPELTYEVYCEQIKNGQLTGQPLTQRAVSDYLSSRSGCTVDQQSTPCLVTGAQVPQAGRDGSVQPSA